MAIDTQMPSVRLKTTPRFDELYGHLNREQKRAVEAIEGPVMVLAGPGTGKTQVLTMRIANILLQTQMDPWNILCLTFTESGVAAMRERLHSIIGTPAYYVRIHTFHSFCNEIIQEHPDLFTWTRSLTVVADVEKAMMFRAMMDSLSARSPLKPFGSPYLYFRDVVSNIQDLKQEDISPDEFMAILDRLQGMADLVTADMEDFFVLKPKERTEGRCQQIHELVAAAAKKTSVPGSMRALLQHLFDRYQKREASAEGVRDASKTRTEYKNELKGWFAQVVGGLPKQREMANVYRQYQEALKRDGKYDYEDMIMLVVKELQRNESLRATYQEQFQYMLVDEYQDTNGAQNEVVNLLTTSFDTSPNVFVVGDDKQSIYRFQGASLANMLQFYDRFKDSVQVVTLKENYRSQQTILDAATAVITHNEESLAAYVPGVTQELYAATARVSQPIAAYTFQTEEVEDYFVARRIQELLAAGVDPDEIAVLYRYNRDGVELLRLLRRLEVPARLEIGENILDARVVQQWLNLWRWIVTGETDAVLASILQYPWWHLSAVDVLKAIHYAGARYMSLYLVISDEQQLDKAGVKDPAAVLAFAELLAQWRALATNLPLQQFLDTMVGQSHFLDHIMENHEEAATLREVTMLLKEAKQLNAAHQEYTLADFVEHVRLLREHDVPLMLQSWQGGGSAVHLMSAHKAKGLEFEHVFITRLNDKHWGNVREANKLPLPQGLVKFDYVVAADANEDERRLFYVAATRAKQQLTVTRSMYSASGRPVAPSIFWHEIPSQLMVQSEIVESEEETVQRQRTVLLAPPGQTTMDDVREYIRSLLDGYVLSVTHLNNYLQCPRKFYFRNLLKIPMAKSKSLAMGSAVHDALYDVFTHLEQTGSVMTLAEVLAAYERHLSRELLAAVDRKDALEQGRHILQQYYNRYKTEFYPRTLLEYDFASHHVRLGNIPITGKIDKIEILDPTSPTLRGAGAQKKEVNVVDYKTGRVDTALTKLRPGNDYWRQIVFYQLLANQSPRFDYTMVSGEVDFLEETSKGQHIKKKVVVSDEDIAQVTADIEKMWEEIHALKFLEVDGVCDDKECEWH